MTDYKDQLSEAFAKHENQGPDPAEVYARVQELARVHRWRRRGAVAAGGAALGASLIAGAMSLPTLFPGTPHNTPAISVAGAPGDASPSPSGSPSQSELDKDWAAYFAAGYGYDDAVRLAQLWNMNDGDIGAVKAEAGRRLLAGETLPIQPGPESTPPVPEEVANVDAFFAAGYTYEDAVTLAALWHTEDPYHAKIEGGRRLRAGETLPIQP